MIWAIIGKPGRGKTHLAIAIAYRAIQNGYDALFTTAAELNNHLFAASREGRMREELAHYPHVLIVDEVGYLTYGDDAGRALTSASRWPRWTALPALAALARVPGSLRRHERCAEVLLGRERIVRSTS